jgi:hypothetical protein
MSKAPADRKSKRLVAARPQPEVVVEVTRGPIDEERVDAFLDLLLAIKRRTEAK